MKRIKLFLLLCVLSVTGRAQVVFNEIMFDPLENEYHDEFIELFNTSFTDSVDPAGWTFSDSSGRDSVLFARGPKKIGPREFALILDGSYFGNSTTYDSIVPPAVCVLTIDDHAFGSSGLSNSQPEYLSLRNSSGDTLCRYRYSIGNRPGYSDEKIDPDGNDTADNWRDALVAGGTPGQINSVSARNSDPGLRPGIFEFPDRVFEADDLIISLHVVNFGVQSVYGSAGIVLFDDLNNDRVWNQSEFTISDTLLMLDLPNLLDSVTVNLEWKNISPGRHHLVALLSVEGDERHDNNFAEVYFNTICRHCEIAISEIMFRAAENEPEWVEIFNHGSSGISLYHWAVTDGVDTARIDCLRTIAPGAYSVLTEDSLAGFPGLPDSQVIYVDDFPTLNNSGDDVFLLEPAGSWTEHVGYQSDWMQDEQQSGVSLERIQSELPANNPENWGPCVDQSGATPGKENSIIAGILPRSGKLKVTPNPFSPDNDGYQDTAVISGELPQASAKIRCRIYDMKGRLRRTLAEDHFSGHRFGLLWNGKDDEGRLCKMGIYIIFIEALNNTAGTLLEMKSTVVLAHRL